LNIYFNIYCFSYILKDILPKITTQFESLKPSFTKIDRMEDLICRVNADFDVLERQIEEAERTIAEGSLKNVLKMPLSLFNKQLSVTEVTSSATLAAGKPTFSPHLIFRTEEYFDE